MEQRTGSKLGKEYIKAVYCHPAYLSYMQNSVQFSCSVVLTLCDPMDCGTPGHPVRHQLLEFTQTHVCWVGDTWNAGVYDSQAGIKIPERNTNNFRYADDTSLMAESEEELKSLLMKVKEESEKAGLKVNIWKTKIMASGLITSCHIKGEIVEAVTFYFLGFQNHCRQ